MSNSNKKKLELHINSDNQIIPSESTILSDEEVALSLSSESRIDWICSLDYVQIGISKAEAKTMPIIISNNGDQRFYCQPKDYIDNFMSSLVHVVSK